MKTYYIEQNRRTLSGSFSSNALPIIKINAKDRVVFGIMDGDWHIKKPDEPKSGCGEFFTGRVSPQDDGHALIGPIYINNTKPGDVLSVKIVDCRCADWGWSRIGGQSTDHETRLHIKDEYFLNWDLDNKLMIAKSHLGHKVKMVPFLGLIGVAPAEGGCLSTHPPRSAGGNLDCCDLTIGSTLYLPVFHEGALLWAGDGHARQGNGELGGTAIECPMEKVELEIDIERDWRIKNPCARTPYGFITFGFSEDMTNAAYNALNDMADLMIHLYAMDRNEAIAMTSIVCDMKVTQIVNGVRGVHVVLPFGAFSKEATK